MGCVMGAFGTKITNSKEHATRRAETCYVALIQHQDASQMDILS